MFRDWIEIAVWLNHRAFVSHAGVRGSIHGRDRPKSLKQVMIAQWQTLGNRCVSRVLGDDQYKRFAHVTVGVARYRILTAQWLWVQVLVKMCSPSLVKVTPPNEWNFLEMDAKSQSINQSINQSNKRIELTDTTIIPEKAWNIQSTFLINNKTM